MATSSASWSSKRVASDHASSANLEALYAPIPGVETRPAIDVTLTTRERAAVPSPRTAPCDFARRIDGKHSRVRAAAAWKLMSMTRRVSLSADSTVAPGGHTMPALFSTQYTSPRSARTRRAMAAAAPGAHRSALMQTRSPVLGVVVDARFEIASSSAFRIASSATTSTAYTTAPRCSSRGTTAWPKPPAAPVTTITCPASDTAGWRPRRHTCTRRSVATNRASMHPRATVRGHTHTARRPRNKARSIFLQSQ
mmetsp:Transcript_39293/g.121476  ORF Transcript_39293/g.121476 Transcript_39293/m.121476 type:complete len:253 (+) Transcript_39293:434-1192(+)